MLTVFSWRDVVLMNVIPGIAMSALILVYLGRLHNAEKAAGFGKEAGADERGCRFRSIMALLTDRAVVTLSVGSTFRTMTQSASTDVPAGLSRARHGLFAALDRRVHVRPAGRGLYRRADCRIPADTIGRRQIVASSMSMTAVVLLAMIFRRRHDLVRLARGGARVFPVRRAGRAAGLAPGCDAAGMGGSAIGILFGAQAVGAAVGPICAGVLADHFGIMAAFYFLAATILVANLLIFVTPSGVCEEAHSRAGFILLARRSPRRHVPLRQSAAAPSA